MIFVSVGTHQQGFNRLIKKVDELIAEKKIKDVIGQIGNCSYTPKNFKFKKFMDEKEYNETIKKADLIIGHAGAGTIINSMKMGKKLILVPRLKKYNEHNDNHQIELGKALSDSGNCLMVTDMSKLEEVIKKIDKIDLKNKSEKKSLIIKVNSFLNEIEGGKAV